ncbi:MAG: hypothetical protein LBK98_08730 [Peptococcaceae bacterium]|jgi:hypothetical protein|nr:hypothetical protein [Peptococcaceae bacterium]
MEPEELIRRASRHESFWGEKRRGEGAYIAVTAPNYKALAESPAPGPVDSLEEKWFNVDYRVSEVIHAVKTTYYGGDAVPVAYAHYGPANLSGLLGADYRLTADTIFFGLNPLITDLTQPFSLAPQREGKLYKAIKRTAGELAAAARGEFVVGIGDIGSNLDTLSALMTRESLFVNMLENPELIKGLISAVFELWREFYSENRAWVTEKSPYMSAPSPFVYSGKWSKVESETAVMISPAMFEEFIAPALARQIDFLDKAMFNLDGSAYIKHLSQVMSLEGLHSIAYSPAVTFDPATGKAVRDFTDPDVLAICARIQATDKKLVLQGIDCRQVETLLKYISPDGVFLMVRCDNEKEAEEFTAYTAKWRR